MGIFNHLFAQSSNGSRGAFNSPGQMTTVFVAGFFVGLYWFCKGLGAYRVYHSVEDIPRTSVRSMAMGLVHVSGTAEGGGTILSPVSQTPCLFYRVRVERPKERSEVLDWFLSNTLAWGLAVFWQTRDGGPWKTERVVDSDRVFHLNDGTAKVAVDLRGADFLLDRSEQCKMDPVSAYAAAGGNPELVSRNAIGNESPLGEQCRVTEFLILPGGEYDVTGECVENPDACDGYDRNLIRKGSETFLVSDQSARNTQAELRHRAAVKVFGGATAAIICLAGLLGQFGLM